MCRRGSGYCREPGSPGPRMISSIIATGEFRWSIAHSREKINVSALEIGETYLFHYPYVSTPCFLINLGRPVQPGKQLRTRDGQRYRWQGGAGPERSIVAFSAICAHKMSHPAPTVSFINYRHDAVKFRNSQDAIEQRSGVIYCCSERSVYDPASGGRVLGGPAPQPLAAIELDYDSRWRSSLRDRDYRRRNVRSLFRIIFTIGWCCNSGASISTGP